MLLGAGSWGVLWYPLRALAAHGLGGVWLTVVLYTGGLLTSLWWVRQEKWMMHQIPVLFGLAFFGGLTNIGFVLAVLNDNILRVTLLFYLSPVWAVLLARLYLKERLPVWVILGALLALLGMATVLWRHMIFVLHWPGLWALGAGLSFAIANVLLRANPGIPSAEKAFATFLGVVIVGVVVITVQGQAWPAPSIAVWLESLVLGAVGLFLLTVLVQYGVGVLPIRQSAVFLLSEVVAAALSQHFLLHRPMGLRMAVGAIAIAAGATVVASLDS